MRGPFGNIPRRTRALPRPMDRVSVARLVSRQDELRGLCPRNVYDFFLQRAGPDGFAPILPEAIHGGTMASL
jgi:hypothetical protein